MFNFYKKRVSNVLMFGIHIGLLWEFHIIRCLPSILNKTENVNIFKCSTTNQTIPAKGLCNCTFECEDKSDESQTCNSLTSIFRCQDGRCIEDRHRCDGQPHCSYSIDEQDCDSCQNYSPYPAFYCFSRRECARYHLVCGEKDNCRISSHYQNCFVMWMAYKSFRHVDDYRPISPFIFDGDSQKDMVNVAQVKIDGRLVPGSFIWLSSVRTFISYDGNHLDEEPGFNQRISILIDPKNTTSWISSLNVQEGLQPVIGGKSEDGETLLIGRALYKGSYVLGAVVPSIQSLLFWHQGVTDYAKKYEILAYGFQCKNKISISPSKVCDCFNDCGEFEDERNCKYRGSGNDKFPCQNYTFMTNPYVRLYSSFNLTAKYQEFKLDRRNESLRCLKLNQLVSEVDSVDTSGTCVRFYSFGNCNGLSIAYYPTSSSHTVQEKNYFSKWKSLGFCFDNEFDHSIFEWNATTIVKLQKTTVIGLNDHQLSVPDLFTIIRSESFVKTNTTPIIIYNLGHGRRVEYISAIFRPEDMKENGQVFLPHDQNALNAYNGMEHYDGDSPGYYFTRKLKIQPNLWGTFVFPQTSENRERLLRVEDRLITQLRRQRSMYLRIFVNFETSIGTRPSGFYYEFSSIYGYAGRFYLTNLGNRTPRIINHKRRANFSENDGTEDYGTKHPEISTTGLLGWTLSIIVIIFGAAVGMGCWVRLRRKWKLMEMLSEDEIKEFLTGKQINEGQAKGELNGDAYKQPFENEFIIHRERLTVSEEILGSGEFGIVMRGLWDRVGNEDIAIPGRTKMVVAIKTVKPNAMASELRALMAEIRIMAYLGNHPNIIRFHGCCTENLRQRELLAVVEFCEFGNLEDALATLRCPTGLNYVMAATSTSLSGFHELAKGIPLFVRLVNYAKDIAQGMAHLTTKRIIHGDLACRNILVTGENVAKVSDFGLSRQLHRYSKYLKKSETALPWQHMAFESLKFMEFSIQSDCWSYGVTLYEIFGLAATPYPKFCWDDEFMEKLAGGYRMPKPAYADRQIYEMMLKCWDSDPLSRPPFSTIVDLLEDVRANFEEEATISSVSSID